MKMNITRKEILKFASNADVYRRGFKYYDDRRTLFLEHIEKGSKTFVKALIGGEYRDYDVSVEFTGGELSDFRCDCEAHVMWRGACKHVVCALLSIYDEILDDEKRKEEGRSAAEIIENFKKGIGTFQEDKELSQEKVRIRPCFYVDEKDNKCLGFTIGYSKMYIVKNIYELVDNICKEEEVIYGKELKFTHCMDEFDKKSRELIKFIRRSVNYGVSGFEGHSLTGEQRYLYLSDYGMDEFFNLCLNQEIEADLYGNEFEGGYVTKGGPAVQFEVLMDLEHSRGYIKAENFDCAVVSGGDFDYIFTENFIYIADKNDYVNILLQASIKTNDNLVLFEGSSFFEFTELVLPLMLKNNLLSNRAAIENMLPAYDFKSMIYLDTDKTDITAKTVFQYGDMDVTAGMKSFLPVLREPEKEYRVMNLLKQAGFNMVRPNFFRLSGDEGIYEFFTLRLEELKDFSDVLVSDDFSKKALNAVNKFSLGFKIKGDFLEINIDASAYSLEELYDAVDSYNLKKKYYRFKDGSIVDLNDREISAVADIISTFDLNKKDFLEGSFKVPKYRALYAENRLKEYGVDYKSDCGFEKLTCFFNRQNGLEEDTLPLGMETILRQYQKEGFFWMTGLYDKGFGGILADDMGLGKTIQAICLMLGRQKKAKYPNLVIAPTSLVYNWDKEIVKFAPELKSVIVTGTAETRKEILKASKPDVFITTYEMLKRDIEIYKKKKFHMVFADEAQNIKNPATKNAKAVKALKAQSRFALTGTPIENSLSELWSIFDFIMPGYLYSYGKFAKNYELPILRDKNDAVSQKLKMQTAPFILRRIKKEVLYELPEKTETVIYADMTEEQRKIYIAYFLRAKGELGLGEGTSLAAGNNKIDVLAHLTRLRQICCHPSLFIDGYCGGSGKLDITIDTVLSALQSGHRILLFSQFTSMLGLIMEKLKEEGIEFYYLDGSVPAEERTFMCDEFNSGLREVFLISLRAGGTGLNLTGADVVIHYDQWWNPAVMNQASDRAYRIGQNKAVQVINIVARESIEEKILDLQNSKRNLAEQVIETGLVNYQLTEDEIRELFL